jgi:N-acetylneuraminic acid mutarotase
MNVICDKVYIFGGLANGRFTNSLYTYDPKAGMFELVEYMSGDVPDPRAFHNAMVFGTKILIYGGFNQEYLTDYYSFNTLNNTWTEAEIDGECPGSRERATLAPYVEDKVVLFGGYYCSPDMEVEEYLNDLYVLNLSLMEWIKPAIEGDLPTPRSAHTSNFVHGKMFMFGGMTKKNKNLNDIWVLKATPTLPLHWKKIDAKGTIPEPRHGHSAVVVDNNIIYFGGRGNGSKHPLDDLFVFDTLNEQWSFPRAGGIRPTPRYYHSSVPINGGSEIMIFGGVRPKEFLSYPRIYILETKSNGQFEEIPEEESVRTD